MGNKLAYPEVDLTGKVALVTGGNTGIGYETAKALARLGAHTFIACRNKERAEKAIAKMKEELLGTQQEGGDQQSEADAGKKDVKIEFIPLDLGSFQATKECVRLFKEKDLPLHILINNAAIAGNAYSKTVDGLEIQFHVNHLGPTLLTLELLPILVQTAQECGDVRVVFVASSGHTMAEPFDPEALNKPEENYKRMRVYMSTKLYNIMAAYCIQRRLQNKNITVSSANPGYVKTELDREMGDMKLLMAAFAMTKFMARTPAEGATTSLNCAVNPELNSQQHFYYDSCKAKLSNDVSRNEEFQEQLWTKTFEFLKDHLSPETIEKYGPREEVPAQTAEEVPAQTAEEVQDKTEELPQGSDTGREEEQNKEGDETAPKSEAAITE